jgi:outer membrane receptor protein involved in Fe transport
MLWSFYVQDSLRPLPRLSLDVGVRFDRTTLLVPAHQWSPRVGAAVDVDADTVVRASFGRFFQPPQPEYLLLSSSVQARELSPFSHDEEGGGADVEPERQTALEAGVEHMIGASTRVSATGWLRRVRNAADPNVFFGTTIIFPNSVARGRARGLDVRLELQRRRGWSGYLSYGLARVIQTGPITGGLFLEDEIEDIGPGVEFVPDHDQRHALASGITYDHTPTGISLSLTGRYQSGTPIQREDDDEEELMERPGIEMVDLESGRVKARTTVDLAVAAPLARTNAVDVVLRGAVLNLFDAGYAFNFGNPFSGTHFGPPRTAAISLSLEFD